VNALQRLHTALRPEGLLLDIRPARRHPWVEIVTGGALDGRESVIRLGQLDDSFRMRTLATADAALQTLIKAGQFVPEHAEAFTFVYHWASVDVWLVYMAEQWNSARIGDELIAHAREEFEEDASELRILRTIQATRLRRV